MVRNGKFSCVEENKYLQFQLQNSFTWDSILWIGTISLFLSFKEFSCFLDLYANKACSIYNWVFCMQDIFMNDSKFRNWRNDNSVPENVWFQLHSFSFGLFVRWRKKADRRREKNVNGKRRREKKYDDKNNGQPMRSTNSPHKNGFFWMKKEQPW